jgi:hypothetical protein
VFWAMDGVVDGKDVRWHECGIDSCRWGWAIRIIVGLRGDTFFSRAAQYSHNQYKLPGSTTCPRLTADCYRSLL